MTKTLLGSPFLFTCMYISITICAAGFIWRLIRWYTFDSGADAAAIPLLRRITGSLKGMISSLFTPRIFLLPKILVLDVLIQVRVLKTSYLRWITHILIFSGFTGLILMHALDSIITAKIFDGYYPTVNPYQFLRDLFGLFVIIGIVLAIVRRTRFKGTVRTTRLSDKAAIAAVAVIILSGFFLESGKILSETIFDRMVTNYMSPEDPSEVIPLKVFWQEKMGTRFSTMPREITPALINEGKQLNADYCSSCHAPTRTAFLSFTLARGLYPAGGLLQKSKAEIWLYYIHIFACFIALALLPFSKFIHFVTDPLLLIINGLSDKKKVDRESSLPRRALEIDGCVNCGACSEFCSVLPIFTILENRQILPAEKLQGVKKISEGPLPGTRELRLIAEGAFACTSCFRCTQICPAGINLQDQWFAERERLTEIGFPDPHIWIKEMGASEWSDIILKQKSTGPALVPSQRFYNLAGNPETFSSCIQCQTCTNVCPVVGTNPEPENGVDITPQKIMNLLRLGLVDLAVGSRMVWDCVTCFQCQENCPQEIQVTEIIYELKNIGYQSLKDIYPVETVSEKKLKKP